MIGIEGCNGPITISTLDHDLAEQRNRDDFPDNRRTLYQYRDGIYVPRAQTAWNIARVLRENGLEWCNGIIVLYICGRYLDFAGVLAQLRPAEVRRYHPIIDRIFSLVLGTVLLYVVDFKTYFVTLSDPPRDDRWQKWRAKDYCALTETLERAWELWTPKRKPPFEHAFLTSVNGIVNTPRVQEWQKEMQLKDVPRRRLDAFD